MNSKSLAILTVLTATAAAAAQSTPPPIPVELRARFGFTGPLVRKVADGFGNLKVVDFDGDGRVEALAFDARRARLVAVRIDDGATTLTPVPTGGQINGYAVADVDGSGKPDLLIIDRRGRLSVRIDGAEQGSRPFDLGLGGRGMNVHHGDLDGDGKQDLVLMTRGKMRVATGVDGRPKLSPVEPIDDSMHSVHLADVNGDGKLDIIGIVPGARMNLRLRLGLGDGSFGPWRIATVDGLRDVFPTKLADGGFGLGTIEGPNRRVAMHRFGDHGEPAALEWWAFGEGEATKTPPFAIGDIDTDGDDDIVLFPKDRAQMVLYEWRDDTFVRRTLPTLSGVTCAVVGDVNGDGKNDLLLTSPEEEAVSWCSGAGPLTQFPEQLPTTDKPVAATISPNGGVLVLARNKRRNAHLDHTALGEEAKTLVDLGRLPADPMRLLAADVGDKQGLEVAFVVPGEGLRTVTLDGSKKADSKTSAGFTRKLADGALLMSEHDGKPALIAVRERFVRRFRFDERAQVNVLEQNNGPEGAQEITLACELGDGAWLYFDKKGHKLVRTGSDAPMQSVELPDLGFTHLVAHGNAALLIGPRGLLLVPFANGPSLKAVTTHEPPTERTYYWNGRSGDFDGDGIQDLVVIDRRLPGVQILAGGASGLQRALAVPVFETRPSESPDSEPRELATGDLDGDGACDFVLIAHDRILIYPQDK